jgi:catechol 2,3-dioxygenase
MQQFDRKDHNDEEMSRDFTISPGAKIGYISLNVSDIQKSLEFYQSTLGFSKMQQQSVGRVLLSGNGTSLSSSHLLELVQVSQSEPNFSNSRNAGLYHFAILLPERKNLADLLLYLSDKQDKVRFDGLADHEVSEAIYIRDPDFNGIEIYIDRPKSEWKWTVKNNMRQLQMATLHLNTKDLLQQSTDKGWTGMPKDTTIGHVHLHVSNLSKAMKFYHEILGMNLTTTYPGAYFFAAGKYHHHIATNTWLGTTNILPALSESIGLNHFGVELPNMEDFDRMVKHLARYNNISTAQRASLSSNAILIQDPDGIRIEVYTN